MPTRNIDIFSKNIILIFISSSLVNLFSLVCQLFIAHRFSPPDFAAFNALLSIVVLVSAPLSTLQTAVAKYSSEFNAHSQVNKIKVLLARTTKNAAGLALLTLILFYFLSPHILEKLKIPSQSCGYVLTLLLALSWISPVFLGATQGLELFKWLAFIQVLPSVLKLALIIAFVMMGFGLAGALGGFLASGIIGILISVIPLRHYFIKVNYEEEVNFREILAYILPITVSTFCFMYLVNIDMILVKYFFASQDSGIYSLAQMVGKIFLFLPGAISIVMFPRISGLNAKNLDTRSTLRRSLLYAAILCILAALTYNLFPSLILRILTGKASVECILLGRLFSFSMVFFTLTFVLITYFLSVKDLRFIKYLVFFTLFESLAVAVFHNSLFQVQQILCITAVMLFLIHLNLAFKK